ncbi:hypothetical protein NE865_09325 [Phthorimaea operculella]|nr:hypothetical protein NE865_09325 [Phthorimaea operculella]
MCAKIILVVCSCVVGYVSSAATYDQRQTGALNVQVDLKDLRIFALMKGGKEEYVDYDYAYDYSEMTIKPQNGTTPKPLNGTTVADTINDNSTAVGITEQTILDIKTNSSQSLEAGEETSKNPINETSTTTKTFETVTTAATEMPNTWSTKEATTAVPRPTTASGCKKGFVMNQKGDCELKMQGAGNALLKLVKLSQKLKLRRENRHNEDSTA